MDKDRELLLRYAQERSEDAFAELVSRHCNLVWTAAYRILCDADRARDAAQAAFSALAQKADRLPPDTVVAGWLYRAACHAASTEVRSESRRMHRERKAVELQQLCEPSPSDTTRADLNSILDSALADLKEIERNALVLRFLCGRKLAEVGAALGISEDATQKRVERALEKLRISFRRRGVMVSGALMISALSAASLQAAPAGLASTFTAGALVSSGKLSGFSFLMLMKKKVVSACAVMAILCASVYWLDAFRRAHANKAAADRALAAQQSISLSGVTNARLDESWLSFPGNDLASLPKGRRVFGKVLFDVQGIIQLQSVMTQQREMAFPERVNGIPIGRTFKRLHLLHGAAFTDLESTPITRIVFHYEDGSEDNCAINYGEHVWGWWNAWGDDHFTGPNTETAWAGTNRYYRVSQRRIQVYRSTFSNPSPDSKVTSIDFVSEMNLAASFIVAVTVE